MKLTILTIVDILMTFSIAGADVVERITDDIITSPNDQRKYLGLRLKNEMKVLLIKDSSIKQAAVSLVAGVGSLNDFVGYRGLAKLVAYALVFGGRPFPDEGFFALFLQFKDSNSGIIEPPLTTEHETTFTFRVPSRYLEEALEKFAKSFHKPFFMSLPTGFVLRELSHALHLMHTDFTADLTNDAARMRLVERTLCHPKSAFRNLFSGNGKTLLEKISNMTSLLEKVQTFYRTWYSSNTMTLTVLGAENLDDLERIVVPLFSRIENREVTKFRFTDRNHPYGPEQLGYKIYMIPSVEQHTLYLKFPIPDISEDYKTAPYQFIADLIAPKEEHRAGLSSAMSEGDLCTGVDAQVASGVGLSFIFIKCTLTADGVDEVDDVISVIFQYLHLMREEGNQKEIFDDFRRHRYFYFYTGEFPDDIKDESGIIFVKNLARAMQIYPIKDLLSINLIIDQWDQPLIQRYLDRLTPTNMLATILSPLIKDKADKIEIHYGTSYGIEKIADELLLKTWIEPRPIPGMHLPEPNEFIPENFNVYSLDPSERDEHLYPYLLHESSKMEIWFKQDDVFEVPKLCFVFEIHNTLSRLSPFMQMLWHTMYQVRSLYVKKILFPAKIAGFTWKTTVHLNKILMKVCGFDDKMPIFLERFLSQFINFNLRNISEECMTYLFEYYIEHIEGLMKDYKLWNTPRVLMNDTIDLSCPGTGKWLRYHDFMNFDRKYFRRIFVRGLLHGNCTKQKAMDIVNIFEKAFHSSRGLLQQELVLHRVVEIEEGLHYYYKIFGDSFNTYTHVLYYQIGDNPLLHLFTHTASLLLNQAALKLCDKLLSDLTHTETERMNSSCKMETIYYVRQAFVIKVVSKRDPLSVHLKVQTFLQEAYTSLKNMTKAEFNHLKRTTEAQLFASVSELEKLTKDYFFEIAGRHYNFSRMVTELNNLRSTTKGDVLALYKDFLFESSPRRRRFSIHVLPRGMRRSRGSLWELPQNAIDVGDILEFSNSHSLPAPCTFMRQHSTHLSTENYKTSSSYLLARGSLEDPADDSKREVHQQLHQTDKKLDESGIKIAQPEVVSAIPDSNVAKDEEQKEEVSLSPMHRQVQTFEKNFEKYLKQRQKRRSHAFHVTEEILEDDGQERETYYKLPHIVHTLVKNLPKTSEHEEDNLFKSAPHTNVKQEETVPLQLSPTDMFEREEKPHERTPKSLETATKNSNQEDKKQGIVQLQMPHTGLTFDINFSETVREIEAPNKPISCRTEPINDNLNQTEKQDEAEIILLKGGDLSETNNKEGESDQHPRVSLQTKPVNADLAQEEELHYQISSTPQTPVANLIGMADEKDEPNKSISSTSAEIPEKVVETLYMDSEVYQQMSHMTQTIDESEIVDPQSLPSDESTTFESSYIYPKEETDELEEPHILHESPISEFWFKQDTEFQLPNLAVLLYIFCPVARLHPSNYAMFSIFVSRLKSNMNTELRGIECHMDINIVDFKICIKFSSFSGRMPIILETFGRVIADVESMTNNEIFTDEKNESINHWVYPSHMNLCLKNVMNQHVWTAPDLIAAATTLRFSDWRKFQRKLFSRVFIRGLIIGNSNKENARRIVNLIKRPFRSSRGCLPQEILSSRTVDLQESAHHTYILSTDPDTYEYWAYFQFSFDSLLDQIPNVIGLLLKFIIEESEPHGTGIMTVEEDIHVRINCKILTEGTVGGFLLVLSTTSEKSITYATMDAVAERYLHKVHDFLKNMSELQLNIYKKELQEELSVRVTNMAESVNFFWKEISDGTLDFGRRETTFDELSFISMNDVLAFFEEILAKSSEKHHKVAIYSFPKMKEQDALSEIPAEVIEMRDTTSVTSSVNLLPLATPYTEIDFPDLKP